MTTPKNPHLLSHPEHVLLSKAVCHGPDCPYIFLLSVKVCKTYLLPDIEWILVISHLGNKEGQGYHST